MSDNLSGVENLPETLREPVRIALGRMPRAIPAQLAPSLPRVWACSDFVARQCIRHPEWLDALAASPLTEPATLGGLRQRLVEMLEEITAQPELQRTLRRFRDQEMLRIAWRDLAGLASLEETVAELSALAEASLEGALGWLYDALCGRYGTPLSAAGDPQGLVVVGMGKLGGGELNFSSDIDLLFAYPESGETDAARPRSNEEFFQRLGRQLIAALDEHTEDGQAYRVDMRLRPYGSAGPLAMSFAAMERYYQDQGREWERYALIKARVVAGDRERGAELLAALRPFVYRRYLDYGALESLREMKALVVREVRRRGLQGNIKLGRGGIREIEFIAQAFQLIRGGQEHGLRERRLRPVLDHLLDHGQLPEHTHAELTDAYRFLRRLENRLQAMHDQQTHEPPASDTDRVRLALAMDYADYPALASDLETWRARVHTHFKQVFAAPGEAQETGEDVVDFADIWRDTCDPELADALLTQAGYTDPPAARERLRNLRRSHSSRALSATGRQRLDHLMPLMIGAVAAQEQPDITLQRLLDLLEGICRRTAYLALLIEHPMALSQLVQLGAGSAWVIRLLGRHPVLLDELLDPRTLYAPLRREALASELKERLRGVSADDLERQMEVLRHFQQANALRVAAADISGGLPIMVVSDYLTEIAEVVLDRVLDIAWAQVCQRYGQPRGRVDGAPVVQGFAILAYGKLGSLEIGYGSDLDLVFIHEARGEARITDGPKSVDNAVFFSRLAQRILHILGTQTPGGVLYEADMRLRPSGKAGLMAITPEAFETYQRGEAWTWEHQALVRARWVAGTSELGERMEALRRAILEQPREPTALCQEVRAMRARMLREKAPGDATGFDIKQDPGGIADIEFMVQYLALSAADRAPAVVRYTDNIRILDALARAEVLSQHTARVLADAYRAYRARLHRLALQERPGRIDSTELERERAAVVAAWRSVMQSETRLASE